MNSPPPEQIHVHRIEFLKRVLPGLGNSTAGSLASVYGAMCDDPHEQVHRIAFHDMLEEVGTLKGPCPACRGSGRTFRSPATTQFVYPRETSMGESGTLMMPCSQCHGDKTVPHDLAAAWAASIRGDDHPYAEVRKVEKAIFKALVYPFRGNYRDETNKFDWSDVSPPGMMCEMTGPVIQFIQGHATRASILWSDWVAKCIAGRADGYKAAGDYMASMAPITGVRFPTAPTYRLDGRCYLRRELSWDGGHHRTAETNTDDIRKWAIQQLQKRWPLITFDFRVPEAYDPDN